MSNKPIEIGCRVLVINDENCPENIGKIGVAIKFVPKGSIEGDYTEIHTDCWMVESLGENFLYKWVKCGKIDLSDKHIFRKNWIIRLPDEEDIHVFDKQEELETV